MTQPAQRPNSRTRSRSDLIPNRDDALKLFKQGDLVPVYRTLLADLETPVSVYLKLVQTGAVSFLLESVEGGEKVGRYSFIGVNPRGLLRIKGGQVTRTWDDQTETRPLTPEEDPLHVIKAEFERWQPVPIDGLPRLIGGAVGYLSYDVVRFFERLPDTAAQDLDVPEAAFMLPDTLVVFDHAKHQLMVMANAQNTGNPEAAYNDAVARIDQMVAALGRSLPHIYNSGPMPDDDALDSNVTQAQFEANVQRAKEYIAAGDAFQIVLSQRLTRQTVAPPITIYRALRALNPSPYMFFLDYGDFKLMGASPEMLVRYEDGIATTRPIAGTRPRGQDEAEDAALAEDLLSDEKERAEHVMLVDLGRNDIGRVSEYGSVHLTDMMIVERYSHVMHIVSQVQGRVKPGMDAFDLLRATFPAGTLSGAPKVRAMEIIEELEGLRRGPYGGAVGYFSFDGSMDMCITIRSLLMQGDRVYLQAGAGIVADSDPTREFEETLNKARALSVAIRFAEQGLM